MEICNFSKLWSFLFVGFIVLFICLFWAFCFVLVFFSWEDWSLFLCPCQISGQTELKFFWFLFVKWDLKYLFHETNLGSCNLGECGGGCCKFPMKITINKISKMTAAIHSSGSNFSWTGADLEGLFWLRNEGAVKALANACRNHKFLFMRLDCLGGATLYSIFICQYLKLLFISSVCNGGLCVLCLVLWFSWLWAGGVDGDMQIVEQVHSSSVRSLLDEWASWLLDLLLHGWTQYFALGDYQS